MCITWHTPVRYAASLFAGQPMHYAATMFEGRREKIL